MGGIYQVEAQSLLAKVVKSSTRGHSEEVKEGCFKCRNTAKLHVLWLHPADMTSLLLRQCSVGSRVKLFLTCVAGATECLAFAGEIQGWPSLVFVLKEEDYFADLCIPLCNSSDPGTRNATETWLQKDQAWELNIQRYTTYRPQTVHCDPQGERFTLVFTVAVLIMNIASVASGALLDYCGILPTRLVAIFFYTVGNLMIAFATAATALLLFPAITLIGVGGILLLTTNIKAGNLFGRNRSTVITMYNGAFNTGAAVLLLVKVAFEAGFSLKSTFLFIGCLSVLQILFTVFLLPWKYIPYPLPEGFTYGVNFEKLRLIRRVKETAPQIIPRLGAVRKDGDGEESTEDMERGTTEGRKSREWRERHELAERVLGVSPDEMRNTTVLASRKGGDGRKEGGALVPVRISTTGKELPTAGGNHQHSGAQGSLFTETEEEVPTFWSCVFSRLFLTNLIWFSLIQLRIVIFFGALNPLLNLMLNGHTEQVSKFTNAFAFIQLFSIFFAPVNGLIMDRRKLKCRRLDSVSGSDACRRLADMDAAVLALALTATLSVMFSVTASIPVPELQYLTFVLLMINGGFLYGGLSAFQAIAFPPCHFGKLYGTTLALGAVISLLQYPCLILVNGPLQHDPLYMNIAFIALVTLAYAHPINVYFYCRRANSQRGVQKVNIVVETSNMGESIRNIDENNCEYATCEYDRAGRGILFGEDSQITRTSRQQDHCEWQNSQGQWAMGVRCRPGRPIGANSTSAFGQDSFGTIPSTKLFESLLNVVTWVTGNGSEFRHSPSDRLRRSTAEEWAVGLRQCVLIMSMYDDDRNYDSPEDCDFTASLLSCGASHQWSGTPAPGTGG
ncbi:equilibrative nucleobase transporter 1-like [Rhinoraja longicauda]